jgi:hypothetical protein
MSLPPYPNAEMVLLTEFDAQFAWDSGAAIPPDLQTRLPYVTVRRVGGPSDTVNDYPMLQVDVYAATLPVATDTAEQIRAHLLNGHIIGAAGQIDRTICTSAHVELPSEDPTVRRISTQYRATCRRLPG